LTLMYDRTVSGSIRCDPTTSMRLIVTAGAAGATAAGAAAAGGAAAGSPVVWASAGAASIVPASRAGIGRKREELKMLAVTDYPS
jgi:hypothetical protein